MATRNGTPVNKKSAVSGKVPLTTDLLLGEIAINTADGDLYLKKDDGAESVVKITNNDTTKQPKENGFESNEGGSAQTYLGEYLAESQISFVDGTRTFTIAPTSGQYTFYSDRTKFIKTAADNLVIPDTQGLWYIYFDETGTLEATQMWSDEIVTRYAQVSTIHWDVVNQEAISVSEERHGTVMDSATQIYNRNTGGARYASGLTPADISSDGTGDAATDAQISAGAGSYWNEDLEIVIAQVPIGGNIPIYYKEGPDGFWVKQEINTYVSTLVTAGTRAAYNEWTGATWQKSEVNNNDFVLMHLIATNDIDTGYFWLMGQNQYATTTIANDAILTEITTIDVTGLPSNEAKAVASFIVQTGNGYSNAVKSRIRSTTDGADYYDWRLLDVGFVAGLTGVTSQSLADLTDVTLTGEVSTDLLRYNGTQWINDVKSTDFAPVVHTHVETDITDLDRIKWKGKYLEIEYYKNEQVLDTGWTMVANKTTTDRAAPSPIGDIRTPYNGASPEDVFNGNQVIFGNRYTVDIAGYINGYRIYTIAGNRYTAYVVDDPLGTPVITQLLQFTAQSTGWVDVAVTPAIIAAGTVFDVLAVSYQPDPAPTTFTGDWNYLKPNNWTAPIIGEVVHANKALGLLSVSKTDDNAGDRSAELAALEIGDLITAAGQTWVVQTTDDSGSYYDFGVTPAQQGGLAGVQEFVFETTLATPLTVMTDVDYWLTNTLPSGSAVGLFGVDTEYESIIPNNTAYGMDVYVQDASISDDWDVVSPAVTAGGSSGGGGGDGVGEAPEDGTPYARQDAVWTGTINALIDDPAPEMSADLKTGGNSILLQSAPGVGQAGTIRIDALNELFVETGGAAQFKGGSGYHKFLQQPGNLAGENINLETYLNVSGQVEKAYTLGVEVQSSGALRILKHTFHISSTGQQPQLTLGQWTLEGTDGTAGQVLTTDGAGNVTFEDGGGEVLTTKGDLFTYDTDNQRLGVGTDGYVLTADASEPTGLKWSEVVVPPTGTSGFAVSPNPVGTEPTASGTQSIAIGDGATASNTGAIAIGSSPSATNTFCIAIGQDAACSGSGSVAIGEGASVTTGVNSVALGRGAEATGNNAVNINGYGQNASASQQIIIGADENSLSLNLGAFSIGGTSAEKQFIVPYHTTASRPASAVEGSIVYDANLKRIVWYDGTDWQEGGTDWIEIGGYTERVTTASAVDASLYNYYKNTLTANITVSVTSVPDGAYSCTFEIEGNGVSTVTWPASVEWIGDDAPGLVGFGQTLIATLTTTDNGTSFVGLHSQAGDPVTGTSGFAVNPNPVGVEPVASGTESIAIGDTAISNSISSIAMGFGAQAIHNRAIAIGENAICTGRNNVVIGDDATALTTSSYNSVVIGSMATTSFTGAVAVGQNANVSGSYGVAIGLGADSTTGTGVAIGTNSTAPTTSVAIGSGAVSGSNGVRIGANTAGTGLYTTAIGYGATANPHYSVAIGYGMATSSASSVAIGNAANSLELSGTGSLSIEGTGTDKQIRVPAVTTANRPVTVVAGSHVYDTSISKPIWFDGSVWKDAAGGNV